MTRNQVSIGGLLHGYLPPRLFFRGSVAQYVIFFNHVIIKAVAGFSPGRNE